jgi:uncharacterized membrane protein YecN with MAPEG domain
MQQPHNLTALVTVAALLMYIAFALRVAAARTRHGLPAPAMSGDPTVERALRVQGNTLEWLPIFLPSLWLFSLYWNDRIAAVIGAVWIAGRILYAFQYWKGENRTPGFGVQGLAATVLLVGAAAGAVRALMATGGL